jgi:hypothetical protein
MGRTQGGSEMFKSPAVRPRQSAIYKMLAPGPIPREGYFPGNDFLKKFPDMASWPGGYWSPISGFHSRGRKRGTFTRGDGGPGRGPRGSGPLRLARQRWRCSRGEGLSVAYRWGGAGRGQGAR